MTTKEFDIAFKSWFEGIQKIVDDYHNKNFKALERNVLTYTKGVKRIRIISGGGAHAFVDMETGDVLKPASWAAPAKHARGNIFDKDNGLKFMGPYGPAYLRG